jgi:AraC-like DNA-binding protein
VLDRQIECDVAYPEAARDTDAIRNARNDEERVAGVVSLAARWLRPQASVPPTVRRGVALIEAAGGNVRISALAHRLGVTRQHLARQFATHVGMTSKQFARIQRVEAARGQARATRGPVNWSGIAHQVGYYDQAHFIEDFKALSGVTPGAWLQ